MKKENKPKEAKLPDVVSHEREAAPVRREYKNAIYMNMKNDLAFLIDSSLNLYEHQSSFNPNMPLRDLIYVAKEYQKLVNASSLYSSKQIKIPTPRFVVFYNGTEKQPEIRILRLSDAYEQPTVEPELELAVTVYNINPGNNEKLLTDCPLLGEYMQYVNRVRQYTETMELAAAVEQAVTECIKENILKDFLIKHRSEAIAVCIFEFDEEKFKKAEHEAGVEEGIVLGMEQGLQQGRLQGLQQGRIQEINRLRLLIQRMTEAGETDQLANLADEAFMERMYEKYQI